MCHVSCHKLATELFSVSCVSVEPDWSLCGVGYIIERSSLIMGPSLWTLACCQQPQMPLTGC